MKPLSSTLPALVALVAIGATPACVASPAMLAAQRGDRAGLAQSLAERESHGSLSNGEAARLAQAVAERDLRSARGADALDRVRDAKSCAWELDGAFEA